MRDVNRKEIYRYLGYRGADPDAMVKEAVESCLEELERAVTPRYIFRRYEIEWAEDSAFEKESCPGESPLEAPLLQIAGMEIRSRSLSRNLRKTLLQIVFKLTLKIHIIFKQYHNAAVGAEFNAGRKLFGSDSPRT